MLLPAGLFVNKIPSPVVLSVLFSFLLWKRDLFTSCSSRSGKFIDNYTRNLKTTPWGVYFENRQPLWKILHLDNSTLQNWSNLLFGEICVICQFYYRSISWCKNVKYLFCWVLQYFCSESLDEKQIPYNCWEDILVRLFEEARSCIFSGSRHWNAIRWFGSQRDNEIYKKYNS